MLALLASICLASPPATADAGLVIPPVAVPRIPPRAASAAALVPAGWTLERTVRGDLDKDGRPDLVAILKGTDPGCVVSTELSDTPLDTNPRLLVVAFARAGDFVLHLANPALIPRKEDPFAEDPLENGGLEINNGVIRLQLKHWRSAGGRGTFSNELAFRWDGEAFRLIGFDRDHLQRNSGETERISVNYLTRRARRTTGSIDNQAGKTVWMPVRETGPNLESIGNGLEFELKL